MNHENTTPNATPVIQSNEAPAMVQMECGGAILGNEKGVHNQPERFIVDCHRIGKL